MIPWTVTLSKTSGKTDTVSWLLHLLQREEHNQEWEFFHSFLCPPQLNGISVWQQLRHQTEMLMMEARSNLTGSDATVELRDLLMKAAPRHTHTRRASSKETLKKLPWRKASRRSEWCVKADCLHLRSWLCYLTTVIYSPVPQSSHLQNKANTVIFPKDCREA